MADKKWKSLFALATLLTVPGCFDDAPTTEATASTEQPVFVESGALWPTNFVNVCWMSPQPRHAAQRAWVEAAIARTWEAESSIDFIGWAPCPGTVPEGYIKILVGDYHPSVTALGSGLGRATEFMKLNWDATWGGTQAAVEMVAIHEFGHALGFAHEQNRGDTEAWCNETQGSDGDSLFDPWDRASVMNYCNPDWNGNGLLSNSDKAAVHLYYNDFDAGLAEQPRGFVDVTGDGRADYCRFVDLGDGVRLSCAIAGASRFGLQHQFTSPPGFDLGWTNRPREFADVSGDGRADFCRFVGSSGSIKLSCALADAGGFLGGRLDSPSNFDSGWANRPRGFADVNADGRADFCRFIGSGDQIRLSCELATANGFRGHIDGPAGADSGWANRPREFVDVSGDGRADFCRFIGASEENRIQCAIATPTGFRDDYFSPDATDQHFDAGWANRPRGFVDVNADGRADYCRFVGASDSVRLACSLAGATGFGAQFGFMSWTNVDTGHADMPRGFADVNGDGRADFCRVIGSGTGLRLSCMLAEPAGFGATDGYTAEEAYFDPGWAGRPYAFTDVDANGRADLCRIVGHGKGLPACVRAGATSFGYHLEYRSTP